jgi:hypothetical protein
LIFIQLIRTRRDKGSGLFDARARETEAEFYMVLKAWRGSFEFAQPGPGEKASPKAKLES